MQTSAYNHGHAVTALKKPRFDSGPCFWTDPCCQRANDDLVATGGTLLAAIELIKQFKGTIVECACVVELKFLDARGAFDKKGHGDVPIWAMMSEDILTLDGLADASIPTEGYVDDGEAH